MTAFLSRPIKAVLNGDSALMMWLSLNLILLVFFLLLNSIAQPGELHPEAEMMAGNEVMSDLRTDVTTGLDMPTAPQVAWRQDVMTRLRGTVLNRFDLQVLPQGSDADELRVELPAEEVFREDGTLRRPEFVKVLQDAVGAESTMAWSLMAPYEAKGVTAGRMVTLSRLSGTPVAWEDSERRVVQILLRPGVRTPADVGSKVKAVSEDMKGQTLGVDAGGQP